MRTYWYWPFMRHEELPLAYEYARMSRDLSIHTLSGEQTPSPHDAPYLQISDDLPQVRPDLVPGSGRWVASRSATYVSRARRRERLVRELRPEIVHVMFLNYFTDLALVPRLTRSATLLTTVHDVIPHQSRLPRPIESRLLRRLYHNCGHVITTHGTLARRLEEEFAVDPRDISVVPLAVYSPTSPTPRRFPRDRPLRALFFGTLRRNKGLDLLLEAVRALEARTDFELLVAGQAPNPGEQRVVMDSVRGLRSVSTEIRWISPERKREIYKDADLVVLPYRQFGSQSGVLHDAYAYGLPVVVTDVGALGDTVRADATGWVVGRAEAIPIAETLQVVLTSPTEYELASAQAVNVASTQTPRAVATRLLDVYNRAASRAS